MANYHFAWIVPDRYNNSLCFFEQYSQIDLDGISFLKTLRMGQSHGH